MRTITKILLVPALVGALLAPGAALADLIDFEDASGHHNYIGSFYSGVTFESNWQFHEWASANTAYTINGEFGAHPEVTGDSGYINWDTPLYDASALVKAAPGETVMMEAYAGLNGTGALLDSDSVLSASLDTIYSLSVSGSSIRSVVIHDTGNYWAMDDLSYEVIPAPGAVLLGAIGLGLVGWVKRRLS